MRSCAGEMQETLSVFVLFLIRLKGKLDVFKFVPIPYSVVTGRCQFWSISCARCLILVRISFDYWSFSFSLNWWCRLTVFHYVGCIRTLLLNKITLNSRSNDWHFCWDKHKVLMINGSEKVRKFKSKVNQKSFMYIIYLHICCTLTMVLCLENPFK